MRAWNLKPGNPLSLSLASDIRSGASDYMNDHIWELSLAGGDPPALALQTTFGLRARSFRMFPRFTSGDTTRTDPGSFANPPVIRDLFPNFLTLAFSPFPAIDVDEEIWVPQSHAIAGRCCLTNHSDQACQMRMEWIAQLYPTEGQRMGPAEIQAVTVLAGQTGDLEPVVFLTGGARAGSGPYPALSLGVELAPGESQECIWVEAALAAAEPSFDLARSIAARNWDAERTRIELLNASQVEIYTADADWDTAFALAQKQALELLTGPTEGLPHSSYVLTRQPDQGFSLRGDGSDYNHLWNGQSPLETYYLASLILPSAPNLAKDLLRNYLAVQDEDGFIDWKPGLGGQRSRLLATPLLASLAWRIFEASEDQEFLAEIFPGLLKFFHIWFSPEHDRDGDGIPEWDHPMQSGYDDHPLFSRWQPWAQGVEISTAETPSLCAFLYRESQSLIYMARRLGRQETIPALQSFADLLKTAVETAWKGEGSSYQNWDRDTHLSGPGELLGERLGSGEILVNREFEEPRRLLLQVEIHGETTRRPRVFIFGNSASGHHRIEQIGDGRFRWYLGGGRLTGEQVYTSVEKVEIQGLDPEDRVSLQAVGYQGQEQSLLLPLWAGIPDERRARLLVRNTITNPRRYWHPYGLPACLPSGKGEETGVCQNVHLVWNTLIGEGLVRYGFRSEAAELVSHLMAGIIQTLKRDQAFRRYYHADTGLGSGERNALNGLAPLSLFLDVLGVRLISPTRVAISGFNPFPWPVTVKYRGLTVLCQKEKTMVIFPDGQMVAVKDPSPQIVSLELETA